MRRTAVVATIAITLLAATTPPAFADGDTRPVWFVRAGGGPAVRGFFQSRTGSWWTAGAGVRPRTWLSVSGNLGWVHLPVERDPVIVLFTNPGSATEEINRPFDAGSLTIESACTAPIRKGVTPVLSVEAGVQRSRDAGRADRAIPRTWETAACVEFGVGLAVLSVSGHGRLEASARLRRTLSRNPWEMGGLRVTWSY